jgi:hypothetical protein
MTLLTYLHRLADWTTTLTIGKKVIFKLYEGPDECVERRDSIHKAIAGIKTQLDCDKVQADISAFEKYYLNEPDLYLMIEDFLDHLDKVAVRIETNEMLFSKSKAQ